MKIRLLAVGGRMDDWVRTAYRTYVERLPSPYRPVLESIPLATRSAGTDPASAVEREGRQLLNRLRPADYVVVLDERGKSLSSVELATASGRWLSGRAPLVFIIGGPDGLAPDVRKRANLNWSLSPLTLPHGLVRVILAEQLYRAWTIRQGHPYHKA